MGSVDVVSQVASGPPVSSSDQAPLAGSRSTAGVAPVAVLDAEKSTMRGEADGGVYSNSDVAYFAPTDPVAGVPATSDAGERAPTDTPPGDGKWASPASPGGPLTRSKSAAPVVISSMKSWTSAVVAVAASTVPEIPGER